MRRELAGGRVDAPVHSPEHNSRLLGRGVADHGSAVVMSASTSQAPSAASEKLRTGTAPVLDLLEQD